MIKKFNIFMTIVNNVLISKSLPLSISLGFDQQPTTVSQVIKMIGMEIPSSEYQYKIVRKITYEILDFIHRDLESGHVQPVGI